MYQRENRFDFYLDIKAATSQALFNNPKLSKKIENEFFKF